MIPTLSKRGDNQPFTVLDLQLYRLSLVECNINPSNLSEIDERHKAINSSRGEPETFNESPSYQLLILATNKTGKQHVTRNSEIEPKRIPRSESGKCSVIILMVVVVCDVEFILCHLTSRWMRLMTVIMIVRPHIHSQIKINGS